MKRMNLKFAAIVCAALMMGFASCTKDNGVNQIDGDRAVIRISLEGTADTRALDADVDISVTDAYAFILNSSNVIMDVFQLTAPNPPATTTPHILERETTTAASKVIVLGNVGNIASLVTNITTLTELQAIVAEYGTYVTDGKIWTKGEETIVFGSTTAGGEPLALTTVVVYPISTKLNITVNNDMTNWDAAVATMVSTIGGTPDATEPKIAIESVALLYSAAYIHYTDNATSGHIPALASIPASPATYYYSGIDTWSTMDATQTSVNANLLKTWSASASSTAGTPGTEFAETFYAFANTKAVTVPTSGSLATAYGKHPIVTIYGRYNGAPWFWPAHFTTDDTYKSRFDEDMLGGKFYNIVITLSGDANLGGGGDPDPETKTAYITINVTSAGWGTVIDLPTITIQ